MRRQFVVFVSRFENALARFRRHSIGAGEAGELIARVDTLKRGCLDAAAGRQIARTR